MPRPQSRQAGGEIPKAHNPLNYWLEQERGQGLDDSQFVAQSPEPNQMPGGWWLLPVMVMALPVWGVIIWLLVRA